MSLKSVVLPSNSQINKAGECIASVLAKEGKHDRGEFSRAVDVLVNFRAAHQYPLTKATMGLRSMVTTEGCRAEVSQRLKRLPTIIDKIRRHPDMRLSTMQDIGGCRAVLNGIDEVRRVERRLRKNRPPVRFKDYIEEPRDSGYRSLHLIVQYDRRNIEIQLRTQPMHQWAIAVERLSGRLPDDLKSGDGPPELLEWLRAVSVAMALEERGEAMTPAQLTRLNTLRLAAVPYLGAGRST